MKNSKATILSGGRKAYRETVEDACGVRSKALRVIDTLGILYRRGSIDSVAHDAGRTFAEDFEDASLSGIKGIDYSKTGGGSDTASPTERAIFTGQRVSFALDALGGIGSPCGKAAWNVLGLGISLNQWASGEGIDNREARGVLIATLYCLAVHYGYASKNAPGGY